jgi:hypothetical protein
MSDKQATLRTRPDERDLLHWIIDNVIEKRRIRGFLLRQGAESHLVDWLYDARLIHLIKKSIAAKDQAGVRFDAFAVDYGCYVDLLATKGAGPRGLLRIDDEDEPHVPDDDLESIRGAILDLDEFSESDAAGVTRKEPPEVTLHGHAKDEAIVVGSPIDLKNEESVAEWCLLAEAQHGVVVVPIGRRPIRIGSSANDHVRIRADDVVPRHAVIELSGDHPVLISDKGNVYVNELKISTRRVAHRDYVSIGDADLLVFATRGTASESPESTGQESLPV